MRYYREVLFAFALVVISLVVWYAIDVFFLAFATVLLAILLHAIGKGAKKVIRLPYPLSLIIGLLFVAGIFVLIFWLYSPLIVEQVELLAKELPDAAVSLRDTVAPYMSDQLFSGETLQKEFSLTNQKIFSQVVTIFSTTVGTIVSFVIFLIVGFYLAMMPEKYLKGVLFALPENNKEKIWAMIERIGHSLRFWLLGKVLSMVAIGVLTFFGLWFLDVSLALVLGLLAGLLTFIPYVGPILAAIPAILIAFAGSPLLALYVIILYIGVHIAEGYLITPFIEQKTVSIPPALTIMSQILLFVLVGGLGLALASPLVVVIMSLFVSFKSAEVRYQA